MTDIEYKCPQGRDPSDFLSYVEGDLDDATRAEIERHLQTCEACAAAVNSLRRLHGLLEAHPEAFHPDEMDLYRYVKEEIRSDSPIGAHIQSCDECRHDVETLREMMAAAGEVTGRTGPMPEKLLARLERQYGQKPSTLKTYSLRTRLSELLRFPFQTPALALGSVTAVVVMAILAIPLWKTFEKVVSPGRTTVPISEPSHETGKGRALEKRKESTFADALKQRPPAPAAQEAIPSSPAPEPESAPAPGLSAKPAAPPTAIPVRPQELKEAGRRYPAVAGVPTRRAKPSPLKGERETSLSESIDKKKPMGFTRQSAVKLRSKVESPQERQQAPIPLAIRVVDAEGNPIPWLRVEIPDQLKGKYRPVSPGSDAEESEGRQRVGSSFTPGELDLRSQGSRSVIVRIAGTARLYDVRATLSGPSAGEVLETAEALGVSRQDLESKVNSLILSLLSPR